MSDGWSFTHTHIHHTAIPILHPQLRVTDRVLDLATGTADVALLAAEELRRKGLTPSEEAMYAGQPPVLGVDPSANMLALGREKVAARGLGGVVTLALGDAQALEGVAPNSVDKIAMSFGIRNVEDRVAALKEMARVLRKRPESRVGILEFQLPRSGGCVDEIWMFPVCGDGRGFFVKRRPKTLNSDRLSIHASDN